MGKIKIIILIALAFGFALTGMHLMKRYSQDYVHYYPPNISSCEDWPDGKIENVDRFAQSLRRFRQQADKYPATIDELCKIDAIAAVVDPPEKFDGECIKGYISIAGTAGGPAKIAMLDSGKFYLIVPRQAVPDISARDGDAIILADYSAMPQAEFAKSPFAADDCDKFAARLDGKIFVYSDDLLAEWQYFADKAADYKTLRVYGACCIGAGLGIAAILLLSRGKNNKPRLIVRLAGLAALAAGLLWGTQGHPQGLQVTCYEPPAVPPWNLPPAIQLRIDLLDKYHAEKKIDDVVYAKLKAAMEKQLASATPTSSPTSQP